MPRSASAPLTAEPPPATFPCGYGTWRSPDAIAARPQSWAPSAKVRSYRSSAPSSECAGPASRTSTVRAASSLNRAARTDPEDPAPTTMSSYAMDCCMFRLLRSVHRLRPDGLQLDLQPAGASHHDKVHPLVLLAVFEPEGLHGVEEGIQRQVHLEAGQLRAHAVVNAEPEGEMAVASPVDVELVGVIPDVFVAVGARKRHGDRPARGNGAVAELGTLGAAPEQELDGSDVAQRLFDHGADKTAIGAEALVQVGPLSQLEEEVPDEVSRRLDATRDHVHQLGDDLPVAEGSPVLTDVVAHPGDEVVGWIGSLSVLLQKRAEVLVELHRHEIARALCRVEVGHDLVRQPAEVSTVGFGDTHHVGDDHRGQRRGEVGHEVGPPRGEKRGDELPGCGIDETLRLADLARSEGRQDELPDDRVLRRI